MNDIILGIDVGASGIKGNLVDVKKGIVLKERCKILTPNPSTPSEILKVIQKIISQFDWKEKPVGIGFPTFVHKGVSKTANNIDKSWIDFDVLTFLKNELNAKVTVINDADAAGLAEVNFGAGQDYYEKVLVLTLGTGLGAGLYHEHQLIPNLELCYLHWKKGIIEEYIASSAKDRREWSFKRWGKELNQGLQYIESVVNPEVIILGGGISRKFDRFSKYLNDTNCPILPAEMRNNAGIIGAALYCAKN